MITAERLSQVFVEVADTLVAGFDLIEFLHNLADHTAEVCGAAPVGLLLADQNEKLQFMAASSEGAKHLELFQLQHDEGPCLDCFRTGAPVTITGTDAIRDRWPVFGARAAALGVQSVHAFPMRLRDRVIGALNVFSGAELPLTDDDVRVVQAMADVATIAIMQERAISQAEVLTEQLQGALNSRIVIEQAKGMIAQSNQMGIDAAFDLLRSHARTHHLRLGALALDVTTGAVPIPRPKSPA